MLASFARGDRYQHNQVIRRAGAGMLTVQDDSGAIHQSGPGEEGHVGPALGLRPITARIAREFAGSVGHNR